MTVKLTVVSAAIAAGVAAFGPHIPEAAVPPAAGSIALAQSDLDQFMRQVLAKRDENWKKLQQYVLDEHEKVDVIGPTLIPVMGQRREYRWFIKDGFFIRSPMTFDGVKVSDAARIKAEDDYLRQAKERDKRGARGRDMGQAPSAAAGNTPAQAAGTATQAGDGQQTVAPASMDSLLTQTRQPQFIDSAYFLKFKFEQGKYALVGREKFEDGEVLRIEYYPARLFSDNQDRRSQPADPKAAQSRRQDVEVERLMNKNSLVTLWVEPKAKQIVKYAFDNVQTDFLPAAWLFRLDDFKASMTMSQPFKDVWLPKEVDLVLKALFALGTIDIRYHLDYVDYQEATTSGRIRRGGDDR